MASQARFVITLGDVTTLDAKRGVQVDIIDAIDLGCANVRPFVPRQATATSKAMFVVVTAPGIEPWIGQFDAGYCSPRSLTRITNGPRSDQLVVVNQGAGFLLSAGNPAAAVDLDVSPITAVAVDPDADLVVVADFTNVAAFRLGEGRVWSTEVSWDGIELRGVIDGVLIGRGWDAPLDTWEPFEVEVRSGRIRRAPTARPH